MPVSVEVPSFPKPKRDRSKKNLAICRSHQCIVCLELGQQQEGPTQPAHITSVGAGGGNEQTNLMPLCFKCHRRQHDIGMNSFVKEYRSIQIYLRILGRQDVLDKAGISKE